MITVFTSCYNHGQYLRETIASVMCQSYPEFRYILIDDGSDDDTWDIIREYAALDNRIRPIQLDRDNRDEGKGCVLNESLEGMPRGYWTWAPADDKWHPELLEKRLAFAKEHPGECIYGDYWFLDGDGNVTGESMLLDRTPERLAEAWWKTTNLIGFTGIFIPT